MADRLLPYLEKLLADIEKDVVRFKQKSEEAMFLKPFDQWSEAECARFMRESTEQRLARSDKYMQRQIDAEFAARELRGVIFVRGLRGGR
jgi:hypothetical protein